MSLLRIVRLALQCVLMYSVHLSQCDLNLRIADGLCPTGEHDLEPCECINMGNKMDGLISIECGPSTHWTSVDDIKELFDSVDEYFTTHVYRFNMTGTNVTGTLNEHVWGPLDFHQIFMDNNKLQIVDNHAFSGSKEMLTLLSLKNNEITYFHWDHLKELPLLEQLVLQGNNNTFIPAEIFPASGIANLDLSWNTVKYVGPNAFDKLYKLRKLDLSHNELKDLDENALSVTQNDPDYYNGLQIILSDNYISELSGNVFGNAHPEHIDLRNNLLTTVEEEVFMPVITGSTDRPLGVDLTGNRIVCNCGIAWISTLGLSSIFSDFMCFDMNGDPLDIYFNEIPANFWNNCTKSIDKI